MSKKMINFACCNLATLFMVCLLGLSQTFAQSLSLSVNSADHPPYDNMTELIKQHLVGAGIEVLNVEFDGVPQSVGYFTDGLDAVGLQRGLVLTTGQAVSSPDPFNEFGVDGIGMNQASNDINSNAGSAELANISTSVLFDVNVFRISFRTYSDSIKFRYVFGSEEYPEYACTQFNDIFGFFLSGPNPDGGEYINENIALIPGTNLPVSINNIHPANPPNCNTPAFPEYYISNINSMNQPVYDGLTTVFEAKAKVIPCAVYQMVLAIGDVADGVWDTGVFLEAKSFEGAVNVTASFNPGAAIFPEHAMADSISLTFSNIPDILLPLSVHIGGSAINGVDYLPIDSVWTVDSANQILHFLVQAIPDTISEGYETVELIVEASMGCFYQNFTLYIADPPSSPFSNLDTLISLNNEPVSLSVTPTFINGLTYEFSNPNTFVIAPTYTSVFSDIDVTGFPLDTLFGVNSIQSVCVNITHTWIDDLNLYLVAPNGHFLELSTDNGEDGDNYVNTCFTPTAIESIKGDFPFAPASFAPFTGNWQPEGPWSDIEGTTINGLWRLQLVDDNNGSTGNLLNWSIQFSGQDIGNFKYLWSTGETTDSISVNISGTYSVVVSNDVSHFTKTFIVQSIVATDDPSEQVAESPFSIVPNPTTGNVAIFSAQDLNIQSVQVFDLQGQKVLEQNSGGVILGAEQLQKGIYVVALICKKGRFVQRMMRQ